MGLLDDAAMCGVHARAYNREKKIISSTTSLCIVKKVYPNKMLADVIVQQNGTMIRNAIIGNNIIGKDNQLKIKLSENQKCLVVLSNQHSPVIIATIPNGIDNYDNQNEEGFFIGSDKTYIEKYGDEDLSINNPDSSIAFTGQQITIIARTKKISIKKSNKFFRTKDQIQNKNLQDKIISNNDTVLAAIGELLDEMDMFFDLNYNYNGIREFSKNIKEMKEKVDSLAVSEIVKEVN